jgi:hypothetical protein
MLEQDIHNLSKSDHENIMIMMVMEDQTYVFSMNFRSFDFESFWIFDRIVARTVPSLKLGVIKWEWEVSRRFLIGGRVLPTYAK